MKRLFGILLEAVIFMTAIAQTPHIHIYRNDKKFTSAKTEKLSETQFQSKTWGDSSDLLRLLFADGSQESINATAIDSIVFGPDVPVIRVKLLDYPNADDLFKTTGFDKNTIYRATVEMDGNGQYDDLEATEVEFRGRGNSTWTMPKTPYRFKFSKKQSLCGLAKAKTYALIANYIDGTQMRNVMAFRMAQMLGLPYTNHAIPVNVYLNDKYRGAYFLTEKIGIGGASVDIDETKGMLFELDSNYDEDFKFRYKFNDGWYQLNMPVMVKDPDLNELAEADPTLVPSQYFAKWQTDMTKMMDAVTQRSATQSLADVLDLQSVVDYMLVYLVTGNHELKHPKSCYLWKESLDADARYHFGPVWDFDWAFTYDGKEGGSKYNSVLLPGSGNCGGWSFFKMLMKNQEIRKMLDARFEEFRTDMWPNLKKYLDEYAAYVEPSAKANGVKWPADGSRGTKTTFDFRKNYDEMIQYLEKRIAWIPMHPNMGLYD